MKKIALAALAAVLVLAVAGVIAWPHFKVWQVRRVLDTVVIPQMQDSLHQMGWGAARTTYQGVTSEGPDFTITGLALVVESWPKIEIKVDRLLLKRLNLTMTGNLNGLDCRAEGVAFAGPFGLLAAQAVVLEGITQKNDWQDIAVGRYALTGLTHQGPGGEAPAPIGSLEGRDYALDQERGGTGFAATLGPAEFKAGYFSLNVAKSAFSAGAGTGEAWARSSARVEMTDLTLSAGGKTIPMQRGEISATVGEAAMRTRLAFSGLIMQVNDLDDPQARAELKKLGYDRLKLQAALAYRFERERGILAIDELFLDLERAGKITASLELGGVKRDLINAPGQDLQWLEDAYLQSLRLAYQDRSLTSRVMANLAKERGIPEPLFKELAVLGLQAKGLWHGVYLGALPGFIKNPDTLCLEARPRGRLSLGRARRLAPEQLVKAWNVKLTACR
jgi:hypothetical protein